MSDYSLEIDVSEKPEKAAAPTAPADNSLVLAWKCVFLGCGAVRIWEGGQAGFNLPSCRRCGSAVAQSQTDSANLRHLIRENLF